MNILFIDPVCWKEHSTYNRYWIEIFQKKGVCFKVILEKDYAENIGIGSQNILFEYSKEKREGIIAKIQLLYMIFAQVKVSEFDYVVFSVVDKRAFLLSPFFLFTKSIIVSHTWNCFCWAYNLFLRILAIKHCLVSIDPYIQQNLLVHKIPNALLVHPSPNWMPNASVKKEKTLFCVYIPGRNSNHEFIEMIQGNLSFGMWLQQNSISLSVRSSVVYRNLGNILFTNLFLTNAEYKKNIDEADLIIIPYDQSFINRISNVFFEAIALKKNILIKRNTHLDNYEMFDPEGKHIRFFSTVEEMEQQLLYFKIAPAPSEHFYDRIIEYYSVENMGKQFCNLIKID